MVDSEYKHTRRKGDSSTSVINLKEVIRHRESMSKWDISPPQKKETIWFINGTSLQFKPQPLLTELHETVETKGNTRHDCSSTGSL
jgi:hypothetical protein